VRLWRVTIFVLVDPSLGFLDPSDAHYDYYQWRVHCAINQLNPRQIREMEANIQPIIAATSSLSSSQSPSTIPHQGGRAICRSTRYLDVPTISRLLASLECFNHHTTDLLAIIAEYSQHFQRLYAVAAVEDEVARTRLPHRFYFMESLPSYHNSPSEGSSSLEDHERMGNQFDERKGRMNDWRRVAMTTKAGGDPRFVAYHDYITATSPGDDLQVCQVPSPYIMAPPLSKDTSNIPAKKPVTAIEGDDVMRVTCGRWTPIKGGSFGVEIRDWTRYQFIDVIDYSNDVDEENVDMNSLTLSTPAGSATTTSSQNTVEVKKKARYWYWGKGLQDSTVGLHYQEMDGRRMTFVQPGSPAMDIVSRYEDIIYLFELPRMCTFNTITEIWNEYQAPAISFPSNSSHRTITTLKVFNRTFTIPKCGIFMYAADHYHSMHFDDGLWDTTLLYQPMCDKWTFLEWQYPHLELRRLTGDATRNVSCEWQRSMIWYNNTVLLIPLIPHTVDIHNLDKSKEVVACYMLAPHLITRHYTPVTASSGDKHTIGDMLVTITLPQKVELKDWIRIDDLPSFADDILMSVTSIY
jgi:hypothetical protein